MVAAACTESTPLQVDVEDLSLTIVGGDGQEGLVGEELPQPLTVLIETTRGKKTTPAKGVVVNFVVTVGGGRVYAGAGVTDANGLASDYWTLGPAPGPQELEVRAVDGDGTKHLYETFHAVALLPKTAKPVVASPIFAGATSVAGTSEPDATVTVFVDGAQVAVAQADASGSWTLGGLSPLTVGQSVTAVATAPGGSP